MILYEFEGKKLLSEKGLAVPKSQLIKSPDQKILVNPPLVIKAQILSGKRKDAGGVVIVEKESEVGGYLRKILGKRMNKEVVKSVLVEEKIDHKLEYYVSISYDTTRRAPVLTFSSLGGSGVEERKAEVVPIDPITLSFKSSKNNAAPPKVLKIIPKLIDLFFGLDLLLLEINPLIIDTKGRVFALDAKLKTDDSASGRHADWNFPARSIAGYRPTKREIKAKKIDEGDYRGSAGSTYFDLPGDIAVLASGGGASLTAMDALLKEGGRPANYTEYSGNPPKEKVKKLTKIVLSKPNIHGLWVVGAVANFTDIYETLSGFIEALREVKPRPAYPIVIRRGGPRDKEAFEMLRKIKDYDLHLYGQEISITESAKIVVKLAQKYATFI